MYIGQFCLSYLLKTMSARNHYTLINLLGEADSVIDPKWTGDTYVFNQREIFKRKLNMNGTNLPPYSICTQ